MPDGQGTPAEVAGQINGVVVGLHLNDEGDVDTSMNGVQAPNLPDMDVDESAQLVEAGGIQDPTMQSALSVTNQEMERTHQLVQEGREGRNRTAAIHAPITEIHNQTREVANQAERRGLFDELSSRLGQNAADLDRQQRIDRDYGKGIIGRANAKLAGANLKQGANLWEDLGRRAIKIAGKTTISGAVGYATLAVFTATASWPILAAAVTAGAAGRSAVELIRWASRKESKGRAEIEKLNEIFINYLRQEYQGTETLRLQILEAEGNDYDVESDPRFVERIVKIFAALEDESQRRVVKLRIGEGYEAVGLDAETTDEMINVGELSKKQRTTEKRWETAADIVSAVSSLGAGIANKIFAGKKIAEEAAKQSAARAAESLKAGHTIGIFDFDNIAPGHFIQMDKITGQVNYLIDMINKIPHYIGSDLVGTQAAIAKEKAAEFFAKQIPALVGLGVAFLGQVLYRPVADSVTDPVARSDEEIKTKIEETKRGIESILQPRPEPQPFRSGENAQHSRVETAPRPYNGIRIPRPGSQIRIQNMDAFRSRFVLEPAVQDVADFQIVSYSLNGSEPMVFLNPILPEGVEMPDAYAAAGGVGVSADAFFQQPLVYQVTSEPQPVTYDSEGAVEDIQVGQRLRLLNNGVQGEFTDVSSVIEVDIRLDEIPNGTEFTVVSGMWDGKVAVEGAGRRIVVPVNKISEAFEILPDDSEDLFEADDGVDNQQTQQTGPPPPPLGRTLYPPPPPGVPTNPNYRPDQPPVLEAKPQTDEEKLAAMIGLEVFAERRGSELENIFGSEDGQTDYTLKIDGLQAEQSVTLSNDLPGHVKPGDRIKIKITSVDPVIAEFVSSRTSAALDADDTGQQAEAEAKKSTEIKLSPDLQKEFTDIIKQLDQINPAQFKLLKTPDFIKKWRDVCHSVFRDNTGTTWSKREMNGFDLTFDPLTDGRCSISLSSKTRNQKLVAIIADVDNYSSPQNAKVDYEFVNKYHLKGIFGDGYIVETLAEAEQGAVADTTDKPAEARGDGSEGEGQQSPELELDDDTRKKIEADILPYLKALPEHDDGSSLRSNMKFIKDVREISLEFYKASVNSPSVKKRGYGGVGLTDGYHAFIATDGYVSFYNRSRNHIICKFGSADPTNPSDSSLIYQYLNEDEDEEQTPIIERGVVAFNVNPADQTGPKNGPPTAPPSPATPSPAAPEVPPVVETETGENTDQEKEKDLIRSLLTPEQKLKNLIPTDVSNIENTEKYSTLMSLLKNSTVVYAVDNGKPVGFVMTPGGTRPGRVEQGKRHYDPVVDPTRFGSVIKTYYVLGEGSHTTADTVSAPESPKPPDQVSGIEQGEPTAEQVKSFWKSLGKGQKWHVDGKIFGYNNPSGDIELGSDHLIIPQDIEPDGEPQMSNTGNYLIPATVRTPRWIPDEETGRKKVEGEHQTHLWLPLSSLLTVATPIGIPYDREAALRIDAKESAGEESREINEYKNRLVRFAEIYSSIVKQVYPDFDFKKNLWGYKESYVSPSAEDSARILDMAEQNAEFIIWNLDHTQILVNDRLGIRTGSFGLKPLLEDVVGKLLASTQEIKGEASHKEIYERAEAENEYPKLVESFWDRGLKINLSHNRWDLRESAATDDPGVASITKKFTEGIVPGQSEEPHLVNRLGSIYNRVRTVEKSLYNDTGTIERYGQLLDGRKELTINNLAPLKTILSDRSVGNLGDLVLWAYEENPDLARFVEDAYVGIMDKVLECVEHSKVKDFKDVFTPKILEQIGLLRDKSPKFEELYQKIEASEAIPEEGAVEITLANGEKVKLEKDQKWKLNYSGRIANVEINDVKPEGEDFIIQFTDSDSGEAEELTLGKEKWQETIFKNAELIKE